MRLVEKIERFKINHCVASGPEGAHYVALGFAERPGMRRLGNVPWDRPDRMFRPGWVASEQAGYALSLTVTAVALNLARADAFDPLRVHLPVLRPQHLQPGPNFRHQLVRGLVLQQLAHFAAIGLSLVQASLLLAEGRPRTAWRALVPFDGQTGAYAPMCTEFVVGLPIYACVLAAEAGVAWARRAAGR